MLQQKVAMSCAILSVTSILNQRILKFTRKCFGKDRGHEGVEFFGGFDLQTLQHVHLREQSLALLLLVHFRHRKLDVEKLFWPRAFSTSTDTPRRTCQPAPKPLGADEWSQVTRPCLGGNAAKCPIFRRNEPARQVCRAYSNRPFPPLDLAEKKSSFVKPIECAIGRTATINSCFWE